jgi:glycosyltransferase involved in cell wall biosynthesis
LRIALLAPPWLPVPPPAYGGTESVVDVLARGLEAAGHEVLLFATGDSTCPVRTRWRYDRAQPEQMGAVVVELEHVTAGYEAAVEAGVDVIHDHTALGPLVAGPAGGGIPVVVTSHGPFTDEAQARYGALGELGLVVAISHHQAASSGRVPIAAVVHHGLELDRYPVGDGSGGHLMFLGRMSPDKGVHTAIEVARRAELPLLIAAKLREPAERRYFDEVVAPLLDDDVRYVGEATSAEKLRLLGRATALLNPLHWDEPFGLVMVEALACGTPVLATPRGAVPEIVDDGRTGFLRSTPEALAVAARSAARLDRRACREVVANRFSAPRMVRGYLDVYRMALRRKRQPEEAHA